MTSTLASLRAATTPTRRGKAGSGLRRSGSHRPSARKRRKCLGATTQQLPVAGGTDVVEHQLGGASRCIEADALVVSLDEFALRGQRLTTRRTTLPDASVEARRLVGERQVDVPRGAMHADLSDLALDPTVAETAQGSVDTSRHSRHRGSGLGNRLDRKLGHSRLTLKPGPASSRSEWLGGGGSGRS